MSSPRELADMTPNGCIHLTGNSGRRPLVRHSPAFTPPPSAVTALARGGEGSVGHAIYLGR